MSKFIRFVKILLNFNNFCIVSSTIGLFAIAYKK